LLFSIRGRREEMRPRPTTPWGADDCDGNTVRAWANGPIWERAMSDSTSGANFIELTATIVAAYVSHNSVSAGDLAGLIHQVHAALTRVTTGHSEVPSEPLKPAVSVKRSITPDYIVCLEDGKKFKSLKRHLRTQYNMTPEAYREKWDLPPDYPMVAPNYAAARSQLAKQMGLGQQRRRRK
jgi:predicted transcriptional regulator